MDDDHRHDPAAGDRRRPAPLLARRRCCSGRPHGLGPVEAFPGSGTSGGVGGATVQTTCPSAHLAGHDLPGVPCGQLLEHRHLRAAHSTRSTTGSRTCTRQPPAPRLRPVLRRPAGAVRHPDHGRVRDAHQALGSFTYASESDKVKYPLGSDTKIEGGPGAGGTGTRSSSTGPPADCTRPTRRARRRAAGRPDPARPGR